MLLQIKSTNGTRLAQILKSLPGNTASNPEKLYDPVQLLIEIGIEKLKNDYTQSFLISKIALADHLKLEINNKLILCIMFDFIYFEFILYFF